MDSFTFEHEGSTFKYITEYDTDHGYPWNECDGHGEVREAYASYGGPDTKPGERIIHKERNTYWIYDVAAAVATAKTDGWSCDKVTPDMSKGQRAAVSVEADIKYITDWLNGDRFYVYIEVFQVDRDGKKCSESEYLGGIDSGYSREGADYVKECACGLAGEILYTKRKEWRAALTEARARKYWETRDVMTA